MHHLIRFMLAVLLVGSIAGAIAGPLQGSHAVMERQNAQADLENLSRLDEEHLTQFKVKNLLVPLPDNDWVTIDSRLPEKYRWCRPYTQKFLTDIGKDFHKKFGRPIQVNSAVRTTEYQATLQGVNGNAAPYKSGPHQSSHLTGATIDIGKKEMSPAELKWMRKRLIALKRQGYIEATEEFHQLVFHIMVFKKYDEAS